MINKKNLILLSVFCVCSISTPGLAEETDSYNTLSIALNNAQDACVGISEKLSDLKRMAGINTAVSAVGTVSGGVALGTGIAKARIDKQLEPKLAGAVDANRDRATEQQGLNQIPRPSSKGNAGKQPTKDDLKQTSKTLGNIRTGTLAVSGASNIVGAVISANNSSQDDLQSSIEICSQAVKEVSVAQMQVRSDNSDPDGALLQQADIVISKCSTLDKIDFSDIIKKVKGAMISSTVGATTGIVGTVLSALANKSTDSDDAQKVKNLNTGSNVLAGATTVASASAIFFNATQIGTIKQMAAIAEECEGAF